RKVEASFETTLERLRARLAEIQRIDFFSCPRAQDVLMLFKKAERLRSPSAKSPRLARIKALAFRNKTWLTRPHPEIDRVASAWLIKRFIDPRARFVFAPKPEQHPGAIPYDMVDVEFTHQGDDCTFETLIKRFELSDKRLRRLGEMVHEADLSDGKFSAVEAIGIDHVLKGLAHLGWNDESILKHGSTCFDALYARLKER
ncbi:MAG: chromate resistance protein, partial [Verrucomicrobiota bacterium]|nr:chromate resistance protein [Verrucomicrobiota bacterium]